MQNKLTKDFLYELYRQAFRKSEIIEVISTHIKYTYLPSQEFKKLHKAITTYYNVNRKIPTFGIISQQFESNVKVIELLSKIKDANLVDKDKLLEVLEEFIKQAMFIEMYENIADLYNENKKEQAYHLLKKTAEKIHTFSITSNTDYYDRIFKGFRERHRQRILMRETSEVLFEKVPLGIDELDALTYGGLDETDTVLYLAQSGVGKTKFLRWNGVSAARRGYRVLHIQAEGSKEETLRGYDSTWTGITNQLIQFASYDDKLYKRLLQIAETLQIHGGEIFVHAYEQFTSPSIAEVRKVLIDIEKNHGHVDLLLLDYFELFSPGDGKKYQVAQERDRRRAIGRALKNLAIEFKTRIVTATQAQNIPLALSEDPSFVMTRNHLSEFKNAAEPFSMFVTMNQTKDEKQNNVMRLYVDKLRNYPSDKLITICQSYKNDRFYDRKCTLSEFYFPEDDE